MMDAKTISQELAGGFLEFSKLMLSMSLKETIETVQKEQKGNPLKVYEAAEAARIIFTNAYQVHHRLMSVANSMRIEEVG